jgi:hypothetical protein
MIDCLDSSIGYIAAAAANCLVDGLSLSEIRKLHALLQLITHNVQATINLMTLASAQTSSTTSSSISSATTTASSKT